LTWRARVDSSGVVDGLFCVSVSAPPAGDRDRSAAVLEGLYILCMFIPVLSQGVTVPRLNLASKNLEPPLPVVILPVEFSGHLTLIETFSLFSLRWALLPPLGRLWPHLLDGK